MKQLEWKVGGQQGEGVDSTGEIFAHALFRYGYFVTTYKQFMSRIKGGHTNYKILATQDPKTHAGSHTQILLALDDESYSVNQHELVDNAVVIFDGELSIEKNEHNHILVHFPLKQMAKELGNVLAKNMIALGVSAGLIGLPNSVFSELVQRVFGRKGEATVKLNQNAVQKGYELVQEHLQDYIHPLEPVKSSERLFLSGNEATAFGSLMAGCRFLSAYPITPASEIMEWLSHELPKVGGTIMQVEDEIAGITFAIGASFAGARAMTTTSGPGLSLKTEALGMAGMSETPLVIVDSQRAGPSTGLPTKFEQSDIQHLLHASHGEFPRIVIYPYSIENAFYLAFESFNLADKYQCPVFFVLDLAMSMNKTTIRPLDANRLQIDRGKLLSEADIAQLQEPFKRYKFTEDGISPRVIPGTKGAVHPTSSNEHDEQGYITEEPELRTKIMNKRMKKIQSVSIFEPFSMDHPEADTILVGMGSTHGILQEVAQELKKEKINVGHVQIQQIHPLPVESLTAIFENKKVIVVENNYEGQLLNWLKQHIAIHNRAYSVRQYDGNPFTVETVIQQVKELM